MRWGQPSELYLCLGDWLRERVNEYYHGKHVKWSPSTILFQRTATLFRFTCQQLVGRAWAFCQHTTGASHKLEQHFFPVAFCEFAERIPWTVVLVLVLSWHRPRFYARGIHQDKLVQCRVFCLDSRSLFTFGFFQLGFTQKLSCPIDTSGLHSHELIPFG